MDPGIFARGGGGGGGGGGCPGQSDKLEDLTVLKRSPDLFNNVKIGQDTLRFIMKHILFYGGCSHFGVK